MEYSKYQAFIFDVDGTLYNQGRLRMRMLMSLLSFYSLRPHKWHELKTINTFRKERELRSQEEHENLEIAQYEWAAEKTGLATSEVRSIINRWIMESPLPHLKKYIYPGIENLFKVLKSENKKVAIYSDYPASKKLEAMNLEADLIVASTDKEINAFKPDPKGLIHISQNLNVSLEQCVFLGDRVELDGKCAANAEMDFIDIKEEIRSNKLFFNYLAERVKV